MAPRPAKGVRAGAASQTLVVDNGGSSIKAGFAGPTAAAAGDATACQVIPNCLAKGPHSKTFVGAQLNECNDFAEMLFRRPVQRGVLVNWEAEKEIWDRSFFDADAPLHCDPKETNLLLTEAPNSLAAMQVSSDQMAFEEFEFAAYRRCIAPTLNAFHDVASIFRDPRPNASSPSQAVECLLVVDCGFSHTTVTPLYHGRSIQQAVSRLEVGGKLLTNQLKELLSVRQMDLRDESYMMNQMKEEACFVSRDFRADMERTRPPLAKDQTLVVDYVLPDYSTRFRGEQRPHNPAARKQMSRQGAVTTQNGAQEYVVTLGSERFAVPELLFHPTDIGLRQPGLPDLIMQSLAKVPTGLWPVLLANVYVVGGTASLPGFMDRLYEELRQRAPAECIVRVTLAPDPIKSTWQGGVRLIGDGSRNNDIFITRADYQEHGEAWVQRQFAAGLS